MAKPGVCFHCEEFAATHGDLCGNCVDPKLEKKVAKKREAVAAAKAKAEKEAEAAQQRSLDDRAEAEKAARETLDGLNKEIADRTAELDRINAALQAAKDESAKDEKKKKGAAKDESAKDN